MENPCGVESLPGDGCRDVPSRAPVLCRLNQKDSPLIPICISVWSLQSVPNSQSEVTLLPHRQQHMPFAGFILVCEGSALMQTRSQPLTSEGIYWW